MRPSSVRSVPSQRGSAVVEFVFVGTALIMTAITVMSISISSFLVLALRDSAIEGARYAALADQGSLAGCARARTLAEAAFGRIISITSTCRQSSGAIEVVELSARLPLLGFLGTSREVQVRGSAPREN